MNRQNRPSLGEPQARTPTDPELVDRLARLRTILPLLASDLAAARRRAYALELDNRRLARRIAELESMLAAEAPARGTQRLKRLTAVSVDPSTPG